MSHSDLRAAERPAGRSAAARCAPRGTQPLLQEELERAQRVASGQISAEDLDWLSKGFSAFLANGGSLQLERCLRLPWKDGDLRRACRDYWLRRAWKLAAPELSPWRRSELLAGLVRSFAARQWVRWRNLQSAPAERRRARGRAVLRFPLLRAHPGHRHAAAQHRAPPPALLR